MRQGYIRLDQRIEQVSQAVDQAIEKYDSARDNVLAQARQGWEQLMDQELVILAQQQEAHIYGQLAQAEDRRTAILEALEHATEMRIIRDGACGHNQIVKLQNRLAALMSQRKK